ncbi:JAB domain-containing protein [Phenylobacterium deserti]|nr:DNA repair protein RadC [Phenylobacterium deserti]
MGAAYRNPLREGEALADIRRRAQAAGPEALDARECLALALRRATGVQAGPLAAALLQRFGSLPEALGAPPSRLAEVAPAPAALEIAVWRELFRKSHEAELRARPVLSSGAVLQDYVRAVLAAETRQQCRALFLDARNRLVRDERLTCGSVDHAPVYPREILRRALELDAAALILVQNRPAGQVEPTSEMVADTRSLVDAGAVLRIAVHDHLLVADGRVVSLRARGLL